MTLAEELFDAQAQVGFVEDRLGDMCDLVFGNGHWDDFDYDPTDCSAEFYGVPIGSYDLGPLWVAGFKRVWLHVSSQRRQEGERFVAASGFSCDVDHGSVDSMCHPVTP